LIAYSFHPDAEAELADAAAYYEARRPGPGRLGHAKVMSIFLCFFDMLW
jgi:hypothetical protein